MLEQLKSLSVVLLHKSVVEKIFICIQFHWSQYLVHEVLPLAPLHSVGKISENFLVHQDNALLVTSVIFLSPAC